MCIRVSYDIPERLAVPAARIEACLTALRELRPHGRFEGILDAFRWWGFEGWVDEDGAAHLGEQMFPWSKLATEDKLFVTIAPYLPDFSAGDQVAIVAFSDEGEHWRWLFVAGKAYEQSGRIVYPDIEVSA